MTWGETDTFLKEVKLCPEARGIECNRVTSIHTKTSKSFKYKTLIFHAGLQGSCRLKGAEMELEHHPTRPASMGCEPCCSVPNNQTTDALPSALCLPVLPNNQTHREQVHRPQSSTNTHATQS